MTAVLKQMLDPGGARDFLASRLGRHLGSVGVLDVSVRDNWVVQYSAEVQPGGIRRLVVQRFLNGDLEPARRKIERQATHAARRDPQLPALTAACPDLGLLIYPFPLDARLKFLRKAVNPKLVARRFAAASCDLQVLRYVPAKRCQFRYQFPDATVYGKLLRDGRGVDLFRRMEQVWELYAGAGDRLLSTPRPLVHLADWNMLVQEQAPGRTLYEMLREGAAQDHHIDAAARASALLHGSSLRPEAVHAVPEELGLIEQSYQSLVANGLAGPRFETVLAAVRDFARDLPPAPLVPVHRDFYDKQLLIDGPRTALIDWDTLALGHPEIDAANFVTHLRLRALEGIGAAEAASRWGCRFLERYPRTLEPRWLRFFAAAAWYRLACKYSVRPDPPGLSDRLLDLAVEPCLPV